MDDNETFCFEAEKVFKYRGFKFSDGALFFPHSDNVVFFYPEVLCDVRHPNGKIFKRDFFYEEDGDELISKQTKKWLKELLGGLIKEYKIKKIQ